MSNWWVYVCSTLILQSVFVLIFCCGCTAAGLCPQFVGHLCWWECSCRDNSLRALVTNFCCQWLTLNLKQVRAWAENSQVSFLHFRNQGEYSSNRPGLGGEGGVCFCTCLAPVLTLVCMASHSQPVRLATLGIHHLV